MPYATLFAPRHRGGGVDTPLLVQANFKAGIAQIRNRDSNNKEGDP